MKTICVQKKSNKIILSGLLLGSMMSCLTQTKEVSDELVGAVAVATLATLYVTRSYWWPSYEHKNEAENAQSEVEQCDEFRSKIAAKRKEQDQKVIEAERQSYVHLQAGNEQISDWKLARESVLEEQAKEQQRFSCLLQRSIERRKSDLREVHRNEILKKVEKAQEAESFA
jgi:hypothetical protein